ncbi:MAG: hypothetical protein CSA86_05345 [Arcobacter sp.]|nr:MAG: hypothetical protein CSA86_05345 [Arcobacter sp.]
MKLVNYNLENQIEYLSENKTNKHFKDYLQAILEDSSKPYYQRADYIGLSLNEIKSKIDNLTSNIQELQAHKKKLSLALDMAKQFTADIFIANGINKIDGNIISSLSLTKESEKTKEILSIKDENKVMGLGYVKFSIDEDAIKNALKTKQGQEELKDIVDLKIETSIIPSKVKVNNKRNSSTNTTDEILELKQVA